MAQHAKLCELREEAPMTEQERLYELMLRIQDDDSLAFQQLYELTFDRAYSLAARILRQAPDVEDAMADCFTQVWEQRHRYSPSRGNVVGWILVIARSRALDVLRRRRHDTDPELEADDEPAADIVVSDFSPRMQQRLENAMSEITAAQRQSVAMAFFQGLTHQEIAAMQALPVGTVKSHIRRGLSALKSNLDDWEDYYE